MGEVPARDAFLAALCEVAVTAEKHEAPALHTHAAESTQVRGDIWGTGLHSVVGISVTRHSYWHVLAEIRTHDIILQAQLCWVSYLDLIDGW